MKKNILSIILLALTITFGFSSCEDMLTGDMDRNVGIEEVAADTLYSYWGIQKSLQRIAERYVILGECRGDLVDGSQYTSDSISSILEFTGTDGSNRFLKAADFYHVINSCNAYIQRCDTAALSGLNRPLMLSEYSQVVTIRAWAYLQLVLAYGRVPYFETPMLSTADMEDFRKATTYVDANTLATSGVAKKVDEVRHVPTVLAGDSLRVIAYPNYGTYGYKEVIAHSSKCIFPQDVVLGDIWLLKANGAGSEADYRQAAQYYYNFLNSEKGGILLPRTNYVSLRKMESSEQYYRNDFNWCAGMFWDNTNKTSQTEEVVTIIPCSKNKLYGEVYRDISELFGFEVTQSVSADSTSTGSVSLEPNFQHQLDASKAYINLNKSQDYEVYIGSNYGSSVCTVFKNAGDARYYSTTDTYNDVKSGSADQELFVTKQNPLGAFTTTYPVIYRKANIWLHYAQALNGAGFPGYAFAILRHGLVGATSWLPSREDQYAPAPKTYTHTCFDGQIINYYGNDCKYWDDTEIVGTDTTFYEAYPLLLYHVYQRALNEGVTFSVNIDPTDANAFDLFLIADREGNLYYDDPAYAAQAAFTDEIATYFNTIRDDLGQKVLSYAEYIGTGDVVCDYISKREMKAAKSAPFLNFNTSFLRGDESYTRAVWYGVTESRVSLTEVSTNIGGNPAMGIHERGCGFLSLWETSSTYNYIDQINKMRANYEGATTPMYYDEIYDPSNLRQVQEAIANLILDELALETAFEGNRFFDLLCFSRLIGGSKGVEQVAKRISERSGTRDNALYSRLLNTDNWYFKLP